jgi:hypothetical protein
MTKLSRFFDAAHTTVGSTFYPTDFVFAAFPSFGAASAAQRALLNAGFADDTMIAVNGREALAFFHEQRETEGLWGEWVRKLSRFMDTEAKFADENIERAKDGAGFVAIRTSTDAESNRVADVVGPFAPDSMERYMTSGVQSLA